jgi:RNA polymerase sigma-70 factor (ECF subfamily)
LGNNNRGTLETPQLFNTIMVATAHEVVSAGLPSLLPRLWRYGLVLARNPTIAADLVQATCLRALEKSSQFEVGTRLDRWVFTPALNMDQ